MILEAAIKIQLMGKRALVCGASQGIGRAIAQGLAETGCQVIALARSEDKLRTLMESLPGEGHRPLKADMNDRDALASSAKALAEEGPVHILINNSGGPPPGPASEAEAACFLQAFEQHVLAASTLSQALLPGMKTAAYGRIINIISTSVKIPILNLGVSNTIRGAMANWAKTMSLEVGPFGITVNNILPGYTKTPRLDNLLANRAEKQGQSQTEVAHAWSQTIPARRFAEPEEVAAAAIFLASPQAGYINGINLPVDGGRTGSL